MGSPENIEANIYQLQTTPRVSRTALLLILFIATIISTGSTFLLFKAEASSLALLVNAFLWPTIPTPFRAFSTSNVTIFEKPKDVKIFAVVGYRNPARTAILNCYLQKNLVENGGLIDEVVFIAETTETSHLEWLDSLTNSSDLYSITTANNMTYSGHDLYLQIDGDVVYIEDHTIPTMVNTKMQHPEALIVSANVIHQSAVVKFHQRPGVIVPYLPESYQGRKQSEHISSDNDSSSSSKNGHGLPWTMLPHSMREFFAHNNNPHTVESNYMTQVQQHYSFLHHLAQGSLGVYKFPSWKNPPSDVSRGAFTCIRGEDMDVISEKSQTSWLRKRTIIDGKGVVAHYNSSSSSSEKDRLGLLDSTDVVQRYQSFAEENICPGVKIFDLM